VPLTEATMTDSPQARFQALLDRHRGIVFKVAHAYCRHAEDCRDLEQEIAVHLWRAFPKYDERRPFSTWMYRIALNVAISFARSTTRRRAEPLDEEPAVADDEPDERMQVLHRFLAQLDHLNRALLLLYLDDHSYREIADVLGITETNVATKLNRLKLRLRDELP
jgi:RNA polymerase sigma factor (sigma-70 family)